MLRLRDHHTGQLWDVPPYALQIHVHGGNERALIIADLLRRLAERSHRRVVMTRAPEVRPQVDFAELNLPDVETIASDVVTEGAIWVGLDALPNRHCLVVSPQRYAWDKLLESSSVDPLCVRLAVLREHYSDPDEVNADLVVGAGNDLAHWREFMAVWATEPGRPMDRAYASRAEDALAEDLDSPAALAVLDELTADPKVAPGAKLETVIELDLVLGLDLVSGIGRA